MHLEDIKKARENIKDIILKTPLIYSPFFSKENNNIYIKCENLQITGAYKIRGALNKIKSLSKEEQKLGVVCSSAGNHAQGVAYASTMLGVKSTIVMPKTTPFLKVQSTKNYGGNIVLHGECYDDAYLKAKEIEKETGSVFIHPFNDLNVIFGQGTIALEIFEQLENVDMIICPIGGGGLISGIALAAKELKPSVKIVGVQAEGANAMELSFKNKKLISLDTVNTIADGIAVKSPGSKTFNFIKKYVDEIITVSDQEISKAFLDLCEKQKLVVEASAATSLAALKKLGISNKNIVTVVSGGNIDMLTISSLLKDGLVERKRLFCFSLELPNCPGQLYKISKSLYELNANIVQLEHNQFKANNRLKNVLLEATVETNGEEHIQLIKDKFFSMGYNINQIF
ncbi:threonine ammonia-lyase [Caproiciproducens sp. MSJ-32]|uniref:threonine ammonia-lyase n=1 Tax=Caproiciproducens sp. MSJ-32 TaxID=2841527 RepID=UPI001C103A71|nr:threonine ammonia-lyase [Caproiciproducens sp. MSJ-32]MBU5454275.1 threonine ammonia-lyase [Caproiciproducens sp. MSJ-32]